MRGVRRRGSTAGSRSAARRSTSSTATSRATTRSSRTASTSTASSGPCRSPAGRTARRTSCSSAGSSRARASSTCSRRTGSCARPAATAGCSSSAAGRRNARRGATSRRAGCGGVEFLGRVSDEEKAQLFRTADVYVSPATGGESFGIVLLEAMAAGTAIVASDIHGYKGVVRRGREAPPRAAARAEGDRRARSPGSSRDDELARRDGRGRPRRAQEFSWERVTAKVDDYYGFVIRRLAAAGRAAGGLPRADPALAARRGDAASTGPTPADVAGVAAGRPALGRPACRPAAAPPAPRRLVARLPLGEREPPDPGRVGDDERRRRRGRRAGSPSSGRRATVGRRAVAGVAPGTGTGTGRSAGRPGRRWRSPSAAAAPRCSGRRRRTRPTIATTSAEHEPPGVAGRGDEAPRSEQQRAAPGRARAARPGSDPGEIEHGSRRRRAATRRREDRRRGRGQPTSGTRRAAGSTAGRRAASRPSRQLNRRTTTSTDDADDDRQRQRLGGQRRTRGMIGGQACEPGFDLRRRRRSRTAAGRSSHSRSPGPGSRRPAASRASSHVRRDGPCHSSARK